MAEVRLTVVIDPLTCGNCAVPFGLEASMHRGAKEDGRSFFCPNGHRISYSQTEVQRLRNEIERSQRAAIDARTERDNERLEREKAERKLRRVQRGVCPKCNRSFRVLARHMATKHAEKD